MKTVIILIYDAQAAICGGRSTPSIVMINFGSVMVPSFESYKSVLHIQFIYLLFILNKKGTIFLLICKENQLAPIVLMGKINTNISDTQDYNLFFLDLLSE
jgi:hypothetical protein